MSIPTGTTHLGFAVHAEELEHDDIISANSNTIARLAKTQAGVDWTIADLRSKLSAATRDLAQAEIRLTGKDKSTK